MERNIRGKLLAPIIALLVILAVFTTMFAMFGSVTAEPVGNFAIITPVNNAWITNTKSMTINEINITWSSAQNASWYNVTIANSTGIVSYSYYTSNTTNNWSIWNISSLNDGVYWINVTAYNSTEPSKNFTYASNNNVTVVIAKTFHMTNPTATQWVNVTNAFTKVSYNISWSKAEGADNYTVIIKKGSTTVTSKTTTNLYANVEWFVSDDGDYTIVVMATNTSTPLVPPHIYPSNGNITVHVNVGTPGVDVWEGGNSTVGDDVLNTSTKDIKYGTTKNIVVNGSANWGSGTYCLYYPVYSGSYSEGTGSYTLTWAKYKGTGTGDAPEIKPSAGDYTFGEGTLENDVTFNRSGLWLIGPKDGFSPNASTAAMMDATIPAWFWVNVSTEYSIALSDNSWKYDSSGNLTVTVTKGGSAVDSMVAITADDNNKLVKGWNENQLTDTNGQVLVPKNSTAFSYACTYTVSAYWDVDGAGDESGSSVRYREGTSGYRYYSGTYGSGTFTSSADKYNYYLCGPWDPPEYNATPKTITVEPNTPVFSVENATQYWNFTGTVTITVKDIHDENLTMSGSTATVTLFNSSTNKKNWKPINNTYYNITISTGKLIIEPNLTASYGWGLGKNGYKWAKAGSTIYVVLGVDLSGNSTEEWNGTTSFTIASPPKLQIELVRPADGVIESLAKYTKPDYIQFKIVNETHTYLSDSDINAENITISGDALLLGETAKTLKEWKEKTPFTYTYISSSKVWNVTLIPTMDINGGSITITVTYGGNTASKTINIGGDLSGANGTVVSISPTSFSIGENITLTVTVKDPKGITYNNANVYLKWLGKTNGTIYGDINSTTGGGSGGVYTFLFDTTQQGNSAPKYIVAYVDLTNVGYGYAVTKMEPRHDMKVDISPTEVMPGKTTEFTINVTLVDKDGNLTGYPDTSGLYVDILDANGTSVLGNSSITDITSGDLSGKVNISVEGKFLKAGTYTVYAYNNSHDSVGYNATIEVTPVTVTCSPAILVQKIDTNASVTFTVTWNGEAVGNGTLKIINMTLTSGKNTTVNDTTKYIEVTLTNGTVTVHNVNASELCAAGSEYAKAEGSLPVETPKAILDPDTIYIGAVLKSYLVTVTIVNPLTDEPISDVYVGLNTTILKPIPQSTKTDSDGKVTFAITPTITGKIYIEIQNVTSKYYIEVKAISELELTVSAPSVNEGEQFTVTATSGGQPVAGVTVTVVGTTLTGTTGTDGTITFTAPDVATTATYTITGTKTGYTSATTYIQVVNLPQLIVTVDKTVVNEGEKFTVTVTSGGSMISGAAVTLDGTTKYTTAGTATFTAPEVDKDTTYTITATLTGYKQSEPVTITVKNKAGVPGFELVTLIAALGIALILLRRHR